MRNRYVFLADAGLMPIAAFAAFALRFDWRFYYDREEFLLYVAAVTIIKPIVLYRFGMYHRYWSYASVPDLIAVVLASAASMVAMGMLVAGWLLYDPLLEFSRAVLFIDALLTLLVVGGVRISVRVAAESQPRKRQQHLNGAATAVKRVLVVGAGLAGTMVVREMERNPQLGMQAVGFLDDEASKMGTQICGIPVFGSTRDLANVVQQRPIDEVIISMPTATGNVLRSIADQCRKLGIVSRTMPGVFELLDGNVSVSRLRQIEIADLLRRAQRIPSTSVPSYLKGRTVLVTGAGGSIGSEPCR